MKDNETIIIVGVTETDEYGNLWVTPQGGGDKVKIAKKREKLHPIFQQGKAVLLHWETYMNKPYVSDAKPVEGELPAPVKPQTAELDEITREDIKKAHEEATRPAPQAVGMWTKEIGDDIRAGLIIKIFGVEAAQKLLRWYQEQGIKTTQISVDLSKLPKLEPKSN